MLPGNWNKLEFDLLDTLTCRVRVLSCEQIQQGWQSAEVAAPDIDQALRRLIQGQLVQTAVWQAQLPPVGEAPLFVWRRGRPEPELDELTHRVRNRWAAPRVTQRVYAATPAAARLLGSSAGRLPAENHRNHDLLLAAVYVKYLRTSPALAQRWVGEDALPIAEAGVKNPDAFLTNTQGRPSHIVESAGRYSREHLQLFHQHCHDAQLSYELW